MNENMFLPLQNSTYTGTSYDAFPLLVSNVNYALLFLVLSAAWMIANDRKVLFSVRVQDFTELGHLSNYILIAVLQAIFITGIQGWLQSVTQHTFYDLFMTGVLLAVLLAENWILQNRAS